MEELLHVMQLEKQKLCFEINFGSRYIKCIVINSFLHSDSFIVLTFPPTIGCIYSMQAYGDGRSPLNTMPGTLGHPAEQSCQGGLSWPFTQQQVSLPEISMLNYSRGSPPPLKEGRGLFIIKLLFHSGARPLQLFNGNIEPGKGLIRP